MKTRVYLKYFVSDYRTRHTHCHLDFKLLEENGNVDIGTVFYLQLSNKDYEYL